ncbi:RNA-directed DNA polymerase, eukaryota, reverse transcriptase zinc-binding domain protein [Tanacetum coccineum]
MGDFNEVRRKTERFGSVFNVQGADMFNTFIANAGLEEIPLGGSSFTWCHKSATKMSKLDRYFNHWTELDGFNKFVIDTWNSAPVETNAMRNVMQKFKFLKVLGDIVNEVQSAFISDRQILDGPFILNEVIQWCKSKKKQSLIFKVDFEKAYDSVRWDFLDDVLKKFGFGNKWRDWIQKCLRSSRGSIIINGSPTEEFQFFKGLKQGDPLSPFLFILIMESLHLSFQSVVDVGLFKGIHLSPLVNLSHMFYADDAVFVGQWCDDNINTLVHVLECFFRASGLRINMSKSKIMGVNVGDDKIKVAASKLGCLILNTPFTYLGTKVGGNMSRVQAWTEIIDKVKSRLSNWKLKSLSIGGRLTLLKSVLGSIPIFHMSIFKVPLTVLRSLESIRCQFFNGHELKSNKSSWVKWNSVLAAKEKGGLGVSSLFALNRALLMKWFWRFYSHNDSLWSRVIKAIYGVDGEVNKVSKYASRSCWRDIINEVRKLKDQGINMRDFMYIKVGNGESTKFWDDIWIGSKPLKLLFPRIYALDNIKDATICMKLNEPSLDNNFRRSIRGGIEQSQFKKLTDLLIPIVLNPCPDRWFWSLEGSGEFSVASIRRFIDDQRLLTMDSKTLWIKSVPIKVNILAWKIKLEALPTRFNISRRGIEIDSILCPICDRGVESTRHIFFSCCLVIQIARKICSWWDIEYSDVNSFTEWINWMASLRLQSKVKMMIQGVFFVVWWLVWSYRNKLLFEEKKPSKAIIFDDVVSISFYWCKSRCKASFSWDDWLKNLSLISLGGANDASLLEDEDYDIYDTYDFDGLNNVQRALCEAFDINIYSDEVEDVYDTTANFMASGDANDASLLEDGDYDIYDTYDLDGLNNVQRALCEAFDINLRGKLRRYHIETEEHLFVSCEVAKEIWSKVLSWWKIRNISITCLPDAINLADRVQMPNHLVAFFDAVVQSTIWFLWRFRNDMSFSLKRPSKDLILNDIKLASYNWISSRGRSVRLNWIEWFDNPCNIRCD